jgi:hypothetical protein
MTNDGQREQPEMAAISVRPAILIALGTAACIQLRALKAELIALFGEVPPHIVLLGIDTTSQSANGLPPLQPAQFVNLSTVCRQLQSLLRRLSRNPRVAAYLPKAAAQAVVGDGAAASPPIARFILERGLPLLAQRFQAAVAPFQTGRLGDLADVADRHPSLAHQGAVLDTSGAIDVIFLGSTTGGTVGTLAYLTMWVKLQLSALQMDGHCSLLLTLPACGGVVGVDLARMLSNAFGRYSELLDGKCGREFVWEAGDQLTIRAPGDFYDSVIVMPEPDATELQAHHRRVGRFAAYLLSARLGTTIRKKLVDMLAQFNGVGPFGQPKLLTLAGFAELHGCAFPNPAEFAATRLGLASTIVETVPPAVLAGDVVARRGLTQRDVNGLLPHLDRPAVPPNIAEAKIAGMLVIETGRFRKAATVAASECRRRIAESFRRLRVDLLGGESEPQPDTDGPVVTSGVAQDLAISAGPAAATSYIQETEKALQVLRIDLDTRLATPPPEFAQNASFLERLKVASAQEEHRAQQDVLKYAVRETDLLLASLEARHRDYSQAAGVLQSLHAKYLIADRPFESRHAEPHAVIDANRLSKVVADAAPGCVLDVRQAVVNAIHDGHDHARLSDSIQAIVARHAVPFSKLSGMDEAMRLAGNSCLRAFENACSAAEPNVRVDPLWDRDLHTSRQLYATLPEDHPHAAALYQSRRVVTCVTPLSSNAPIVLIALDMGVEFAALNATREAVAASLETGVPGFPPFADQRHEAMCDLVAVEEPLWYATLALSLHWALATGKVSRTDDGMWMYGDIPLSEAYHEASARLSADTNRDPRLPSLTTLTEEVRSLLFHDKQHIELLTRLEQSLTEQLQDVKQSTGDPKWQFALLQTRSVARSLLAKLVARQREMKLVMRSRGSALPAAASRLPGPNGQEQNHDAGNGKPKAAH